MLIFKVIKSVLFISGLIFIYLLISSIREDSVEPVNHLTSDETEKELRLCRLRDDALNDFISYVKADSFRWICRETLYGALSISGEEHTGILFFESDGTDNPYNRVDRFVCAECTIEGIPVREISVEMLTGYYRNKVENKLEYINEIAQEIIPLTGYYDFDVTEFDNGNIPSERELIALEKVLSEYFSVEIMSESIIRLS